MKTAAKILGIIGAFFSLLMVMIALTEGGSSHITFGYVTIGATSTDLVWLGVFAISGLLGLAGGVLVNISDTAAGVLMIIACVLGGMDLLFLLGGIFVLASAKKQVYPFQYPPQQYPPYPPYPPYQYQYSQYPKYPEYPPQYPSQPGTKQEGIDNKGETK